MMEWDGYCRQENDTPNECPDCGARVDGIRSAGRCKARHSGPPPEQRNGLRIVLVDRETGEIA